MNQKIRIYSQIISIFLLTAATLIFLFLAVVHPSPVAAQNRVDNPELFNSETSFTSAPFTFPMLQASSVATIYLPLIFRNDLIYSEDFSDEDSGWPEGDDDNCNSLYDGGRYRLDVDKGEECFRFAPRAAELRGGSGTADDGQGSVEVFLYHSEGQSNSALGLYLNGRGGDYQYIFRIWPNNGSCNANDRPDWQFVRTYDDDRDTLMKGCSSAMKRGYGSDNGNTIKVTHKNSQFILYINGTQIAAFAAGSPELVGGDYVGTGVYARAASDKDVKMKYDNFKVYR